MRGITPLIGETSTDEAKPRLVSSTPTASDLLHDLARRVQQLSPDRRDPEHFHLEKSDVAHQMRKLARRIGDGR